MFSWFRNTFAPVKQSDCDCMASGNLHAAKCKLTRMWFESLGYDGSYPVPPVIDLSDTRYAR